MAAPCMQLRIFHRNFSKTAKDCTSTGKNLRNFRKVWKSLAVLGILELSCQGLGILELSWQGLKSTGVSVRAANDICLFAFFPFAFRAMLLLESLLYMNKYSETNCHIQTLSTKNF